MKAEASYTPTAAELRRGVRLHPARRHTLKLRPKRLAVVEVDDVLFATGSAVVFPAALGDDGVPAVPSGDAPMQATGLGLLFVAFHHAAQHEGQRLLICGHTDAEGGARANLTLSEARAAAVYSLLKGDRRLWQQTCDAHHRPEDVQALLAYYARVNAFDALDPGPVDGDLGPRTRRATETFQIMYNEHRRSGVLPALSAAEVAVDGVFGEETWGALFDYYQFRLVQMLGLMPRREAGPELGSEGAPSSSRLLSELARWQRAVAFAHPERPYLGLGESFPVAPAHRAHARSQADRRVELLFFEAGDVPALPTGPSNGDYYTAGDCPFQDPATYARHVVQPGPLFERALEIQTVDELGQPVPQASILIRPLAGGSFPATSDEAGLVRVEGLPPGLAMITLPDGQTLGGRTALALLRTQPLDAPLALAPVVVRFALGEEERVGLAVDTLLYDRSRPRARFRRRAGEPAPAAAPEPSSPPRPKREAKPAHDNLFAVAAEREGWSGGSLDPAGLREVVAEWVGDWKPRVGPSFVLFVVQGGRLVCFGPDGTLQHDFRLRAERDGLAAVAKRVKGSAGAYATFASAGDPIFRGLPRGRAVILLEGAEHDGHGVVPLREFVEPDAAAHLDRFIGDHPDAPHLLYYAPHGDALVGVCERGASGLLEPYGSSVGARRKRIHVRNVDAVRAVSRAHAAVIQRWIGEAESAGPQTLDELAKFLERPKLTNAQRAEGQAKMKGAVKEAIAALKALGPPPSLYVFPTPPGASDDEIVELGQAATSRELAAWKALSKRLDKIAGQHSEGAVFIRVKHTIVPGVGGDSKHGAAKVGAKIEHNIDIGTDGLLVKRTLSRVYQAMVGPNQGGEPMKPTGGAALGFEEEADLETGEAKATYKLRLSKVVERLPTSRMVEKNPKRFSRLDIGAEVSTDGNLKLIAPNGAQAEYNVQSGEYGFGKDFELPSLKIKGDDGKEREVPMGTIYVGLHVQSVFADTLQAYFAGAPGFFEGRDIGEFFDPNLRWDDLSGHERTLLRTFHWTGSQWDKRGTLAFKEFPGPIQSPWDKLSDKEQYAAIQLGLGAREWARWKHVARPPEVEIGAVFELDTSKH